MFPKAQLLSPSELVQNAVEEFDWVLSFGDSIVANAGVEISPYTYELLPLVMIYIFNAIRLTLGYPRLLWLNDPLLGLFWKYSSTATSCPLGRGCPNERFTRDSPMRFSSSLHQEKLPKSLS